MSITELYQYFRKSKGISTDTRTLQQGQLFVALRGPNFNANELAQSALEKGAIAAVIDDSDFQTDKTILVENALATLQQLASHHRDNLSCEVIAITGSNGKTTSKELTAAILRNQFPTYATAGNLNNHIGLPLSLLRISDKEEFAVLELGDNHPGEVKLLSEICRPDIGVVTNVGKDHLEGFKTMEANYRAKAELYDYLRNHDKPVLLDDDQLDLRKWVDGIKSVIRYGTGRGVQTQGQLIEATPYVYFKFRDGEDWVKVHTQLYGKYNFSNLLLAVAIGQYYGVSGSAIQGALESYTPGNNRSQLVKVGSNTIVLDAYNANPSNVSVALEQFAKVKAHKKIIILGDMLELGSFSESEHESILKEAKKLHADQLITVGPEYEAAAKMLGVPNYASVSALMNDWNWNEVKDSWVLIKGSRGIGLEQLMPN